MKDGKYEIGDVVTLIRTDHHNTNHRWQVRDKANNPNLSLNIEYIVEDIDYSDTGKYGDKGFEYTILIGNRPYGTKGVELVRDINKYNRAIEIIYGD